jgi:hypothetical protein
LDRLFNASHKAFNDLDLHLVYRSIYSACWVVYSPS